MPKTLRQLREESGLTLQQIVERMQHYDPRTPRTHTGLLHIENRGTDRLTIIKALAHIYDVPQSVVEEAAVESTAAGAA